MATFEITAPDGRVFEVTGPEGGTKEQALAQVQAQYNKPVEVPKFEKEASAGAAAGMSFPQQMLAGSGQSFMGLSRGTAGLTGLSRIPAVRRKLSMDDPDVEKADAQLAATPGGAIGKIATDIATMAPLAVIPGAASIRGAGMLGAGMGAVQPTKGDSPTLERGLNMATGGLFGSGAQFIGGHVGKGMADRAASRALAAGNEQTRNAVRDATLADAQQSGFVWPPSAFRQQGTLMRSAEGVAGKAPIGQEASLQNQLAGNAVSRADIGIPPNTAITEDVLKSVRSQAAQPYRELAGVSPEAKIALEALQDARYQKSLEFKHYKQSKDPAALRRAEAFSAESTRLEQQLDQLATQAGRADLLPAMRESRTLIAKTHDVGDALNPASGDVDLGDLAGMLGKRPLSEGLEKAAKFATIAPGYTQPVNRGTVQRPGISQLFNPLIFGSVGYGASGGDLTTALGAAALPVAGGAARSALLSKAVQSRMALPKYNTTALPPGAQERYAAIARALALPAIPTATQR